MGIGTKLSTTKLNIQTPINLLSYGYVGINLIKHLSMMDVDISLFPIGPIDTEFQNKDLIKKCIQQASFYDYNASSIKIFHQFSLAERIGNGNHIGFPIFELDKFNSRELHHLQGCDKILVASPWAKEILLYHNINNVSIVPLGVDTNIFYPKKSVVTKTIFLNIGKAEIRKGHDILIDAFKKTMEGKNAELWMMMDNPFIDMNNWNKLYQHPQIKLIPRLNSQKDVLNIIQQSDFGVFPTRGEGFCLPLLEMAACGKMCITTDYSGHAQFSYPFRLIPFREKEIANDGVWFHGQGSWMKFGQQEKDLLCEHMLTLHKEKQEGGSKIYEDCVKMAQKFTWKDSALKLLNGINND